MKSTIIVLASSVVLAALIIIMSRSSPPAGAGPAEGSNVTLENGRQVILISVRGGYMPRLSAAKAGIPTVIRFRTNGSFDCSAAVRIPSLNIARILPQTGDTDISIGSQSGTLLGMCAMGMYRFQINFES